MSPCECHRLRQCKVRQHTKWGEEVEMTQWLRMLATHREDLDSDLQQPRKVPGAAVYHDLHHSWKGSRYKVHRGFPVPSRFQFQRETLLQRRMVESSRGGHLASACVHIGSQVCTYNIYTSFTYATHMCTHDCFFNFTSTFQIKI